MGKGLPYAGWPRLLIAITSKARMEVVLGNRVEGRLIETALINHRFRFEIPIGRQNKTMVSAPTTTPTTATVTTVSIVDDRAIPPVPVPAVTAPDATTATSVSWR